MAMWEFGYKIPQWGHCTGKSHLTAQGLHAMFKCNLLARDG